MSDAKKPDPIEDVREGLGLLFRAAKSVISELPTQKIEETVVTGVKEVGRAVETVASTIEREVFGKKAATAAPEHQAEPPPAGQPESPPPAATNAQAAPAEPTAPEGGVRIAADDKKPE
ncbi:MAG: hypothetical protein IPG50_39370 [Myxococcales bacterium]|nr:hypothetical protein [Myxococcales bacterium]